MFRRRTMMMMMGQRMERLKLEKEQEAESVKMRTTLRSLHRERCRLGRKYNPLFARQSREQECLLKEAENEEWDKVVAASDYFKRQEKHDTGLIKHWIGDNDQSLDEIGENRKLIAVLKRDIQDTEEKLMAVNRTLAVRREAFRRAVVPPEAKVLRRLDRVNVEYGKTSKEIQSLKETVQILWVEGCILKKVQHDIEADLRRLTILIAARVQGATGAFDNLASSKKTFTKMRGHFEKRTDDFKSRIGHFDFSIDNLKFTEKFMVTKLKHRPNAFAQRRLYLRSLPTPNEREITKLTEVHQQVKEARQMDLADVMTTFLKLAEENYMLYLNVAERRGLTVDLKNELRSLAHKIEKSKIKIANAAAESDTVESELLEKGKFLRQLADDKEIRIKQSDLVISQYICGVLKILGNLGFTEDEITKLAGVLGTVCERNVLAFMRLIEDYVNKLWAVETYLARNVHEQKRKEAMVSYRPVTPLPNRFELRSRLKIIVPSHYNYYTEDEDAPVPDAWPCSLTETRRLVKDDLELLDDSTVDLLDKPQMSDKASEAVIDSPPCLTPAVEQDVF